MHWFKRKGFIFLPASVIGWLIATIGVVLAVCTFIDIDSRSHSVSDTLINFVLNLLLIGLAYSFIAYFTSRAETKKS